MNATNEINLDSLIGKDIDMDIRLTCQPEHSDSGYLEKQFGVTLSLSNGSVVLRVTTHPLMLELGYHMLKLRLLLDVIEEAVLVGLHQGRLVAVKWRWELTMH